MLRVFTDEAGDHGNLLGIVARPSGMDNPARQELAAELGFSETVFIDDPEDGVVQIFTPVTELPFAGHPLVGTSWFLKRQSWKGDALLPPAGRVETWSEGDDVWISADPAWTPQENVEELNDAAAVDALSPTDCRGSDLYAWAWKDRTGGKVRARYFAPALGISEDEATGSAGVLLGSIVGRDITIHQGEGSLLHVRPVANGRVAVGGRVVPDELARSLT